VSAELGSTGFAPPPTVWEAIEGHRAAADAHPDGAIDLTIGTPSDPPPPFVADVLARSDRARGYPPSVGTPPFREAAAGWLARRFGVDLPPDQVAASIGSKELVAGIPHWLRLRRPDRDVVLHPEIAYPTYAMGAQLAGCRAVGVPATAEGALDLAAIDPADAARAVCLWSNSPANPTGALDDLAAVAAWGRAHDVPVLSDECYAELTWAGPPRTILEHGRDGVLAVHSLSKRSNLAGLRVGFYAGDAELVAYLGQLRKHAGFLVPGPVQDVATAALADDAHAAAQRQTYRRRLDAVLAALAAAGLPAPEPGGAFYLWLPAPDGDGEALARWFAERVGTRVTPGASYGSAGRGFVRLALVAPDDRIAALADRLAAAR
jgi:succinyldiaminopimelate transaminase